MRCGKGMGVGSGSVRACVRVCMSVSTSASLSANVSVIGGMVECVQVRMERERRAEEARPAMQEPPMVRRASLVVMLVGMRSSQ